MLFRDEEGIEPHGENTQPCVYCVDLAAAEALKASGIVPDVAAGFSLGEVAALTFCGVLTPEDGFRLVCKRASFMDEAAERTNGGMAAVLKLSDERVEELCAAHPGTYPVNYNCPGQVSVAGEKTALEGLCKAVQEAGGRAVPLAGERRIPLPDDGFRGGTDAGGA